MASDDSSRLPSSAAGDAGAAALAEEVRQLKALLIGLQSDLGAGVQASMRERSAELQRIGGELSDKDRQLQRLQGELQSAGGRAEELEAEVARWRDAATRGLDEIAGKARAASERFERETAELIGTLASVRAQLEASRTQSKALTQARDVALQQVDRRQARVRSLRAKIIRREVRRIEMMKSLSWRITAPLRWIPKAIQRALLSGARLRRRLLKR